MSNKNLLNILYDFNEEIGYNPLFEFITIVTIIENKIKNEISHLKKKEKMSDTTQLENLISLFNNIKIYINSNEELLKTISKDKINIYEQCKISNFEEMEQQIKIIKYNYFNNCFKKIILSQVAHLFHPHSIYIFL